MKKQSQVSKAVSLLKSDPHILPKEMSEKLGLPIKRIYVLRNQAMKRIGSQQTTKHEKIEEKLKSDYITNLEAENKKLTEWTMMWKQSNDKLSAELIRTKETLLNAEAVVYYLESKIVNLLKGESL
jgi:Fe2+ transport system protein B